MIRKALPILLALFGLLLGAGAGFALRPSAEHGEGATPAEGAEESEAPASAPDPEHLPDYVKFSNQFVVPLLEGGHVNSMVILSISLEVTPGASEDVYAREPKLRDAFLQVMFDHANAGGFRGDFTESAPLGALRQSLLEAAQAILGDMVTNVLISDIVRQDS